MLFPKAVLFWAPPTLDKQYVHASELRVIPDET